MKKGLKKKYKVLWKPPKKVSAKIFLVEALAQLQSHLCHLMHLYT